MAWWGRPVVPLAVACALSAVPLAGCGYALSGRGNSLPDYIRRIGVPRFVNESNTPDLDEVLTAAVRQEIQGRGRYTVVPDDQNVDAILTARIRPVQIDPSAFTDSRQAQRYRVTILASVEFRDVKADRVFWENPSVRAADEYDVAGTFSSADPSAFFRADQNVLERLARAFARTVVTAIFEAF
jgi:hypothetical protein